MAAADLAARFPSTFTWGAASAAYQVEGAHDADGRTPSVWDTFSHTPGATLNGDTGDIACDHYHRWAEDLDLMRDLGLGAYRFSTSWTRIQPGGSGPANRAGLDFYDRLVDGMLERGVEPWLTLYHWDLPQPIEDRGGWLEPEVVDRFAEYAEIVGRHLGDRVRHWITLNEARTFCLMGYGTGEHAPGRTGWRGALRAAHHSHLAHAAAATALRGVVADARVGIAHDVAHVEPATDTADDVEAAIRYDGAMHRWFLDPTFGRGYPADLVAWYDRHGMIDGLDLDAVAGPPPIDFLGLNYYRRERIVDLPVESQWGIGGGWAEPVGEVNELGWEIQPDGLRQVLGRIARDYAPPAIAITENGSAFPDAVAADGTIKDPERQSYLERHLAAAADAIAEGAPLTAYFAWSLMDNYEWAMGYATRFGIVHVDFATQQRTLKASGHRYRELIAAAP